MAKTGATVEVTIPESNREFQQKSAEVIVVGATSFPNRNERMVSHKPAKD